MNILILGGGFGGIRTALDLNKKLGREHNITLVDKSDCHLFLPSLYEIASAKGIEKEDVYKLKLRGAVCISHGEIFYNKKINFVQAEITYVDLRNREVHLGSGGVLQYDYLVLAFGSEAATFGIPGVREYAFQFKSAEDALLIHSQMHKLYREAAEGKRDLPIKFVIGGAGFTGIELAAELACCTEVIRKECNLAKGCTLVSLFEAMPQILPMVSNKERDIILKRLKKLGISVYTNSPIQNIVSGRVTIKNGGYVHGDIIIWTAGVKASTFVSNIVGLHINEQGRIRVNEFLQVLDYPNIFAVGDNVAYIDPETKKSIPALAYIAIDQGSIAAKNIARHISNKKLRPYKPKYEAWVAPVGGKYAVSHLSKHLTVTGFFGWIIREIVDLRYFLKILPFRKAINVFFGGVRIFVKND